jgi:GrpB-like predicted nucleotidyltransferase (UPF0157 family)
MIKIVEYDPGWPAQFEEEAAQIGKVMGSSAMRIEHVGSTAVPGLAAKPVIDIQISVASLEGRASFRNVLGSLGYIHIDLGDFDRVYPFFQKPSEWPCTHHVHLCAVGSREERTHLAFRDFLREHPAVAAEYLSQKRRFAAGNRGDTLESRERYSLSKSDFVRGILEKAFASGYPLLSDDARGATNS